MEEVTGLKALRLGEKPRVWDVPEESWRSLPLGRERDKLIWEEKCQRHFKTEDELDAFVMECICRWIDPKTVDQNGRYPRKGTIAPVRKAKTAKPWM